MPNTKSAKKHLRQSEWRRVRNRSAKSAVKTHIKRVLTAAQSGDVTTAESEYRLAAQRLDQTAAKGIIHKNLASRQKSRLQRVIKNAKSK
jgi:small subunit ribosomal protein S20